VDVEGTMDPVNKKELKGTHAQRKDKDINNDGKVNTTDKYLHVRRKAISKNIGKKKDDTASLNPKLDSGKGKGSEMEQKESTIRSKLYAVLEAQDRNPNKDKAEKPEDALKGAGAKQMKKDNEDDGRYHDLEKKGHDDATAAGRAGPNAKKRSNDNPKGDKKIMNPPADETKKGQAPAVKVEKYDTMSGMKAAYASMYEVKEEPATEEASEEDVDEDYQVQKYTNGKKDGPAKSFGGNLKKATAHASKMGGDHRVHKGRIVNK
jgi:hypothetical protein